MFEPNTSANKNRKLNKISKILEFINWISQLNRTSWRLKMEEETEHDVSFNSISSDQQYHSTVFKRLW